MCMLSLRTVSGPTDKAGPRSSCENVATTGQSNNDGRQPFPETRNFGLKRRVFLLSLQRSLNYCVGSPDTEFLSRIFLDLVRYLRVDGLIEPLLIEPLRVGLLCPSAHFRAIRPPRAAPSGLLEEGSLGFVVRFCACCAFGAFRTMVNEVVTADEVSAFACFDQIMMSLNHEFSLSMCVVYGEWNPDSMVLSIW